MVEVDLSEVSCETCVAACCRAPMYMQLSKKEFKHHGRTLDLDVVVKPNVIDQERPTAAGGVMTIPAGYGLYELKSGCANLNDENRCVIYAGRPQCCRQLQVGSDECLGARRKAGLDGGPVEEDAPPADEALLAEFFDASSTVPVVRPDAPQLAEVVLALSQNASSVVDALAGCDQQDWARPTCCSPWDVGGIAAHLVDGAELAQRVLRAASASRRTETPAPFVGDQPATIAALRRIQQELLDAFAGVTPEMLTEEVILDEVAAVAVKHLVDAIAVEFAVHRRDIMEALGEAHSFSAVDVQEIVYALPDVLGVGAVPRPATSYALRSTAFAVALTWRDNEWLCEPRRDACTIEGEPEDVLLYALGRAPFDATRLSTNRAEQARAFKRYLTGP